MLVEPTLIKEVERTNAIVIRNPLQGQVGKKEGMKRDPYIMNMNRRRNYYSYREFGYLVWNFRNQEMVSQERKIKYGDNLKNTNNLKKKESLVVFD